MAEKDPKSPLTTSAAYDCMIASWQKIQTVLDGTEALREAGTTYLPQHANEIQDVYDERLACSTLFNMTKITLESWVGRPFSDPIGFDMVPPKVQSVLDDIDLLGNDVHVFARNWFKDGVAKAFSHVLVDYPRVPDRETRTVADDNAQNLRPYWIAIRPEQLFFASAEIVDGVEVLREVRILESIKMREGFAEYEVPQVRRIILVDDETGRHGVIELYREIKSRKKKKDWEMVDTYDSSLPVIPLVTFYADRQDFMVGKSPVEDLADLNIAHWQSTSDQRACVTVARFPLLALSGGTDDNQELVIGPNRWLWCPDAQGRYYYVEHGGAALEAGRMDLADLERQMSEYGAEFLKKRPDRETATARALDSAEATSPLQDMVMRFADALTTALHYTAQWLNLEGGGKALLSTDFGPEEITPQELDILKETRKNRDISRKAFLTELKRRALLADEYDIDADAQLLEQEAMDMFGGPLPEGDGEGAVHEDNTGEE